MANWNGLILTDAGRNLQAKVEAGQTTLTLTKFKLGNGAISGQQTLEGLSDLISPKQIIGINTCTPKENGLCTITGTIVNNGLTKGYELKELGVFANDPDSGEILYAITTDKHPDYLQPEGGATVVSAEFSLNIAISNTDKVTAVIDVNGLATINNVQTLINQHDNDKNAHKKVLAEHNTDQSAHTNIIDDHNADAIAHKDIREALKKASGESIGHIGFTISNIPEGCLILDIGALVSRATYPQLWAFVQSSRNLLPVVTDTEWQTMASNQTSVAAFSTGDGSTNFRLPKLLGWAKGGARAEVGDTHEAGLPNIMGSYGYIQMNTTETRSGCINIVGSGNMSPLVLGSGCASRILGIDASKSNAIYGASQEVQPTGFTGMYYIRAFQGTTNQGNVDITALANEKADVNLSNINAAGKSVVANLSMPSDTFETISVTVNTATAYTAPANGYVNCKCWAHNNAVATYVALVSPNLTVSGSSSIDAGGNNYDVGLLLPVKKGDKISISIRAGVLKSMFCKFYYAEGEI